MLLANVAHFNDLSPKLRKRLEEKVKSFGKQVRYRFNIDRENPDPEKYGGKKTVYPSQYTLDPVQFVIIDKYEDRTDKSSSKRVGLIDAVDEKNLPSRFRKIKLYERDRGVYTLNIESNPEHFDFAMFLELHPKLAGGDFADPSKQKIFSRIDELSYSKEQRKERSIRKLAMDTAEKMSEAEIKEFADAMMWDSTLPTEQLRNMAEDIAENTPEMFNDLVSDKKMKYQAAVKRAVDSKIWTYNPDGCRLTWSSNSQLIVTLGNSDADNDFERLAEWLMTGGNQADKAYQKLLSLEKAVVPNN